MIRKINEAQEIDLMPHVIKCLRQILEYVKLNFYIEATNWR